MSDGDSNKVEDNTSDHIINTSPIINLTTDEWKDYWNPVKYVFYFFDHYFLKCINLLTSVCS